MLYGKQEGANTVGRFCVEVVNVEFSMLWMREYRSNHDKTVCDKRKTFQGATIHFLRNSQISAKLEK
jgi:hypothetical protein